MKQNVKPLPSSQARRQWLIARALVAVGLAAAWGHVAGQSIGLSSHSSTALVPISILSLVAGLALSALTRQELRVCQATQSWYTTPPPELAHADAAQDTGRHLQIIQGNPPPDGHL